jgi:hypothetical protein
MNFTILSKGFSLFITFVLATVLFLSNLAPAFADNYNKGETMLNKIQEKTDELTRSAPPTLEQVQKETKKGINEVQGDADREKMISPNDAKDNRTVEEQIIDLMEPIVKD